MIRLAEQVGRIWAAQTAAGAEPGWGAAHYPEHAEQNYTIRVRSSSGTMTKRQSFVRALALLTSDPSWGCDRQGMLSCLRDPSSSIHTSTPRARRLWRRRISTAGNALPSPGKNYSGPDVVI